MTMACFLCCFRIPDCYLFTIEPLIPLPPSLLSSTTIHTGSLTTTKTAVSPQPIGLERYTLSAPPPDALVNRLKANCPEMSKADLIHKSSYYRYGYSVRLFQAVDFGSLYEMNDILKSDNGVLKCNLHDIYDVDEAVGF
ncbi:hypothetical protein L1987_20720 [Smallanthus sonchifolius]|uniref:Uncharacterized protein n=1 Tax=Smallanthus sonchifolius TaxID=185202 RepID=A0ACB9IU87_9ASTR|nr:hypothetical protein L1987_20720 [Smallanthus sonchifolius]